MKVYVSPTVTHKTLAVAPDRNSCVTSSWSSPNSEIRVSSGSKQRTLKILILFALCSQQKYFFGWKFASRVMNINDARIKSIFIKINLKASRENKNLHKRWTVAYGLSYSIFMVDFIPLSAARQTSKSRDGTRKIAMLKTWRCHHRQDLSLLPFIMCRPQRVEIMLRRESPVR